MHVVPPDQACAVARLDGLIAALNGFREQLIHVEHLEQTGLIDAPAVFIRREIEKRIKDVVYQLDAWTAQE
jgi:hypothetical protein